MAARVNKGIIYTYFNGNGRGLPCRIALHASGVTWTVLFFLLFALGSLLSALCSVTSVLLSALCFMTSALCSLPSALCRY
jgi:hypothetical protein